VEVRVVVLLLKCLLAWHCDRGSIGRFHERKHL